MLVLIFSWKNLVFFLNSDRFSNNGVKSGSPPWTIPSLLIKFSPRKYSPSWKFLLDSSIIAENFPGKFLANSSAWKIPLCILSFEKNLTVFKIMPEFPFRLGSYPETPHPPGKPIPRKIFHSFSRGIQLWKIFPWNFSGHFLSRKIPPCGTILRTILILIENFSGHPHM